MLGSTTLIAAAILASSAFAAEDTHIASCDPGPVTIGSGKATWRQESLSAGPLGVRHRPLREMTPRTPRRPNDLVTKMPVLVEGHDVVTLSVPPRLANRVFLYYGFYEGRNGERSTSFLDSPGSTTVEFRPCADKPRTVWPGGIRVKGQKPVRLLVTVEGQDAPIPLRLGKPTRYTG